jgi:hypothetical protein
MILRFIQSYLNASGTVNEHVSVLVKTLVKKCQKLFIDTTSKKNLNDTDLDIKFLCAKLIKLISPKKDGGKLEPWYEVKDDDIYAHEHPDDHGTKTKKLIIDFHVEGEFGGHGSHSAPSNSGSPRVVRTLSTQSSTKSIFNPMLAETRVPFSIGHDDYEYKGSDIDDIHLSHDNHHQHHHTKVNTTDKAHKLNAEEHKEEEKLQKFIKVLNLHSHTFKELRIEEDLKLMHLFEEAKDATDPNYEKYVERRKVSLKIKNEYDKVRSTRRQSVKAEDMNSLANAAANLKSQLNTGVTSLATGVTVMTGISDTPTDEIRTNVITYEDIVKRMIKHLDHKLEVGELGHEESVCAHMMSLFILYLEEGKRIDEDNGDGKLTDIFAYIYCYIGL